MKGQVQSKKEAQNEYKHAKPPSCLQPFILVCYGKIDNIHLNINLQNMYYSYLQTYETVYIIRFRCILFIGYMQVISVPNDYNLQL